MTPIVHVYKYIYIYMSVSVCVFELRFVCFVCCRHEVEGVDVVWAIKDSSISHAFVDAGAATFFMPQLAEDKDHTAKPLKRHKYTVAGKEMLHADIHIFYCKLQPQPAQQFS